MSAVYELIGRLVVGFVRVRYGRQIKVAGAVVALGALGIAYLSAGRQQNLG